jgi:hypothetical protein
MQLQWVQYDCDKLLPVPANDEHAQVRKYRSSMSLCHELQTRFEVVPTKSWGRITNADRKIYEENFCDVVLLHFPKAHRRSSS